MSLWYRLFLAQAFKRLSPEQEARIEAALAEAER